MARKHTYHRENCDCFIREIIVDVYERTIVLSGQHAFEWSITIYTRERIVQTIYPNGKEARKEFYNHLIEYLLRIVMKNGFVTYFHIYKMKHVILYVQVLVAMIFVFPTTMIQSIL